MNCTLADLLPRRRAWRIVLWACALVGALHFELQAATTYYVAPTGRDSNDGSSGTPWATINHAAITMSAGDTVLIHGGTYREAVYVYKSGSNGKSITFQAYPGEVPVISGADIFTSWTWDLNGTPNAWTIPWTTNLASTTEPKFVCTNGAAIRPEMVIFNGQVLWAVTNRAALAPGRFYVEGPSTNPTAIYALFPNNAAPTGNTVEIATRNHALQDTAAYTVINGLTFRYACNACQDLMVQVGANGAQHILFENNTVEWANAGGLYAAGSYNTFSNNVVRYNGQMGFSGAGSYQLWVDNQSLSNNWKLYNPGWEAGGGKWVHTYYSTIRGQQVGYNGGPGIWFDITNCNNLIERCFVYSNAVAGIHLEEYAIGFTVQNNVICGTQLFPGYSPKYGSGITMLDASSNNIIYNTIYACAADGIFLYSDTRVTNSSGYNYLLNNILAFNSQAVSGSLGNGYQIYVSGQTPAEAASNTFDGNVYWRGASPGYTFSLYRSGTSNSSNSQTDSLATWRSWLGDDASSTQQDPLLVDDSLPSGFYLTAGSPARGLAVPPPVTVTNDFLGNPRPATGADAGAVQYIPPSLPPPGFTQQPLPQRRFVGGTAFFSATVTGGPPVSLQWYLNSTPVAGATNATLTLSNLTLAQAGNYSLQASNATSMATSAPAQLAVWNPDTYAAAVLAAGPAAYWRLNESSGPTLFDCLSTNNGTASAAVLFGAAGVLTNTSDTACHFEATNSTKGDVNYNPALNASAYSFECWARVTGSSNVTACALASRNVPNTQGYYVQASANNTWQFCSGTGLINLWHTLNGPTVVPGQWTHLVGTYTGTTKTFYVNGLPVASAGVQFMPNAAAPLRLGAGATEGAGADFFSGDVDEVAVYGYALSAAQVQAHYQAVFPPPPPPGFAAQPLPQRSFVGGTAIFSATVTGGPPVSLQWYLNSTSLANATNSTLTLSNLTLAQAGNYSLMASNISGVATSVPASLSVWNADSYSAAVLTANPAAYWRLNESNGPTVLDCLSTNNGLASAGVLFAVAGAPPNPLDTACHFEATNSSKVDVTYNPALNASAYSFECWARVTGSSNVTACVLASRNVPNTQGYYVQASANNTWQFCSGTGLINLWHTLNGPAVVRGQWTHLAGTYAGGTKTFYVNGLPVASAGVQFMPNAAAPLRLGAGATEGTGADFFSGDVDQVAVFGYALSAAQVQAHYQAAFPSETLSLARTSGGMQLTWPGGTLQAAPSPNGPWTVVPNAVSPWSPAPTNTQQFYRIRIP